MGEHCPCKALGVVVLLRPQPTPIDAPAAGYPGEVPKRVLLALPLPLPYQQQGDQKVKLASKVSCIISIAKYLPRYCISTRWKVCGFPFEGEWCQRGQSHRSGVAQWSSQLGGGKRADSIFSTEKSHRYKWKHKVARVTSSIKERTCGPDWSPEWCKILCELDGKGKGPI